MRKIITILGILLTVTVLISGSAVAAWVWADHYEAYPKTDNCTGPSNLLDAPDGDYASIGIDSTPPALGWILLDLTSTNAMGPSQNFTVIAVSPVNETYDISVCETDNPAGTHYVGSGWDTENLTFQTPSRPLDAQWRYIFIQGTSGVAGGSGGDYAYGPDLDAVGWDKP